MRDRPPRGIPTVAMALAATALLASAGAARAAPPATSASRDAPVLEYAYGPAAQLSVGQPVDLLESRRSSVSLRLALSALAALENAESHWPLPDELARLVVDASFAVSLDRWAGRALGDGGALELEIAVGHERARELRSQGTASFVDQPRPGDIPFGGGGTWTGFAAAARLAPAPRLALSVRVGERVFLNGWPLVAGSRVASDLVASGLGEGLAHAPSLDATLRWQATARLRPLASLFAEGLFPHDASARTGWFARALVGLGVRGTAGEAIPFVSLDAGSGKGLLINRHEIRLSVGVRHVF